MSSPQIFVAGHNGMVGSAITRLLESSGLSVITRTRQQLDLTDGRAVEHFFNSHSIDQVYLAAAKVGGIHANNAYPADFIADNLAIQLNIIQSAYRAGVSKLLFLGSSCIYPKHAEQPMKESALLTGVLEPTNEPYAIAKIAGIKLCESYNRQHGTDYRSVMPTNLYGQGDNFHPLNSHVIPGLMHRIHTAKINGDLETEVWGSGKAKREFLHVDDMANGCIHVMNMDKDILDRHISPTCSHINIGTGTDCTIRQLAESIAEIIGYEGRLVFDDSKPDGTPRKLLDVSLIESLGWKTEIELADGLKKTYRWYLDNVESIRH